MKIRLKQIVVWVLSLLFITVGVNHFIHDANFAKIVPPAIPCPFAVVYLSGIFEILFGILLLLEKFRRFAAIGIVIFLIAVFPANIYMYVSGNFPQFPCWLLLLRLPIQAILIALVLWIYKNES